MYLKIIGAFLVLTACVLGGYLKARLLQQRVDGLKELEEGMLILEREIGYLATPMRPALARVGGRSPQTQNLFLLAAQQMADGKTAEEAWNLALADKRELQKPERVVLADFGCDLGLTDRELQIKKTELTRLALADIRLEAAEEARRLGRLWRGIGWSAGIFLIIILL